MSGSLKRLLNPIENDEDAASGAGFDFTNFGNGDEPAVGDDYNGEYPRRSGALGPQPTITYSNHVAPDDEDSLDDLANMIFDPEFTQQVGEIDFDNALLGSLDPGLMEWNNIQLPQPGLVYDTDPPQQFTFPSQETSQSPSSTPNSSNPSVESVTTVGDGDVHPRTGSVTTADEGITVCYGILYNIDVKLMPDMPTIHAKLTSAVSEHQHFHLKEQDDHVFLTFPDDGVEFGYLRSGEGRTLSGVRSRPGVALEAVSRASALCETIARATKAADAMVKVDVGVRGPRGQASVVGDELSRGKLWLQEPEEAYRAEGVAYENPHFLRLKIREGALRPVVLMEKGGNNEVVKKRRREEQLRRMVEDAYRTVEENRHLDRVEGGERVSQQLLGHQQEALGFMLERESGHVNERYRLWRRVVRDGSEEYQHKITKARTTIEPEERGGGILADEMGMGKTLSILALTMRTLGVGQEWADLKNQGHKGRGPPNHSGSTLIVVASQLLITGWQAEIEKHLKGGLKVLKYHGQRRAKDLGILRDSHIVLTTFKTLAVEYQRDGNASILHQIRWYRVVLDEAHIIRRPSGTFYRSCSALHANSRWCLTGTPVQNKLADLGTLFSFIRTDPFNKPSVFRRWISDAFEQTVDDDPGAVKDRLVMLLGALCLRRTKDILQLPGVREYKRVLDFTPEERTRYNSAEKRLVRLVRQSVGATEDISKTSLFHVNLGLRLLCNHGTFQKHLSWHKRTYMETVASALGRDGEVRCSSCGQLMPVLGLNTARSEFDEGCAHMLCLECLEEDQGESAAQGQRCPVCVRLEVDPGKVGRDVDAPYALGAGSNREDQEKYFHDDGCSTKMKKVVEDVAVDLWKTKSIIFSCWTRTLELLARHLKQAKIPYLRIDGGCPDFKRQEYLDEFAYGEDNPVLIMTTGTGAHGLNLTCANRIFIVELQWNPSVENQAIARATRLGQTSEVRVMRYMIQGTVEEGMQQQQQFKKQIAAIGFNDVPDLVESAPALQDVIRQG